MLQFQDNTPVGSAVTGCDTALTNVYGGYGRPIKGKKKTTTTEEYDKDGKLIKRIVVTEDEYYPQWDYSKPYCWNDYTITYNDGHYIN